MRLLHLLRRHPYVFAYAGALIPAVAMALAQPVWSRVDEAQHTDFVIQLSHGTYPVADRTLVDAETLRVMQATGVYGIQGPGTYPTPDVSDMAPPPPGMTDRAEAAWTTRHLWQLSYASAEPPLYYALMVPVWIIGDRLAGPMAAIYLLRLIDAALVALLAPMAMAVASRLAAGWESMVAAAVLAALLPGMALDGTRVSDDALSAALGGAVVLVVVVRAGRAWSWRASISIGLLTGAGVLAKPIVIGLAAAVALAMLLPTEHVTLRVRVSKLAVATLVGLLCVAPWLVFNLRTYGDPIAAARVGHLFAPLTPPATPAYILVNAAFFIVTFWGGEPLDALPEASGVIAIGVLLVIVAVAGVIAAKRAATPAPLAVCLAAVAGVLVVAFVLPGASLASSHGRYLYPALPAAAALIAAGVVWALPAVLVRRALFGLYSATALIALGSGMAAWAAPAPQPSSDVPPASVVLRTVDVAGSSAGFSIRIDQLATDTVERAIWLHVSIANTGSEEVDWSVTPTVSTGDTTATGDYRRSAKLPGDVDPGQTESGWIFVPLDPTAIRSGGTLVVRFPDVAPASYRSVADIVFVVPAST